MINIVCFCFVLHTYWERLTHKETPLLQVKDLQPLSSSFVRLNWTSVCMVSLLSSQLVIWPTRTQVNPYPGSPLVPTMEKSTCNQSLGYELTHAFQGERLTRTLGQYLTISINKYY